jgi:hypothetical protein
VAHERLLTAHTTLQAEVNARCGQPAPTASLDGAATEQVAAVPSFARAFAAATGLRVVHDAEGLVLETAAGAASFALR